MFVRLHLDSNFEPVNVNMSLVRYYGPRVNANGSYIVFDDDTFLVVKESYDNINKYIYL